MFRHKVVNFFQFILVLLILAFVGYRVALLLDLVPEDFAPGGVIKEELMIFEKNIRIDAASDDVTAPVSAVIVASIDRFNAYLAAKRQAEVAEEQLEEKCGENKIFRFFMYLGSGKEPPMTCTTTTKKHSDKPAVNSTEPTTSTTNSTTNNTTNTTNSNANTNAAPTGPSNLTPAVTPSPKLPLYQTQ